MKLVLNSISHRDLDPIAITDQLYAIGSYDPPFCALVGEAAAGLKPHHARIFKASGAAYVVDLGSDGCTYRNGKPIGRQPAEIRDGDEIRFGDSLSFRVELQNASSEDPAHAVRVVLQPCDEGHGPTAISVPHFPFLVSRDAPIFQTAGSAADDAHRFLSRLHGFLFLKDGEVCLEDLGSVNGTMLNGVRVDAHAENVVREGDIVAFGTDFFRFRVSVQRESAPESPPSKAATGADTVMLEAPDSFLDIFCSVAEDDDDNAVETTDPGSEAPGSARIKPIAKARRFTKELAYALGDERPRRHTQTWVAVAAIVLAVGIGGGTYWYGAPKRELKELVNSGSHWQAVGKASELVTRRPGDSDIEDLGIEALILALVPQWRDEIDNGRFAEADSVLADGVDRSVAIRGADSLAALLTWIGDIEQYVQERGGSQANLELFRDEAKIDSLLEWWQADRSSHEHLLARIRNHAPEFQAIETSAMSHLRLLQSERAVYLKAIDKLLATVADHIDRGQANQTASVLKDFAERYPRISGLDKLRDDLKNAEEVQQAVRKRELVTLQELSGRTFSTSAVGDAMNTWQQQELPSPNFIASFDASLVAWRKGDADNALKALQPIADDHAWGKSVLELQNRFEQVARRFDELSGQRNTPHFGDALLAFAADLDEEIDSFFVEAIADDRATQQQAALNKARGLMAQAEQSWQLYIDDGGIDGLHRLEKQLSDQYATQARRLAAACKESARAMKLFRLTSTETATDARQLFESVVAEAKRQRQWLKDLQPVLDRSVLQGKLELLPKLVETSL